MTNSDIGKYKLQIFALARKALLALVLVLVGTVLLLHIPAVQQFAGRKAVEFLSTKTHSNISIDRVSFSILGDISIDGLQALDPADNLILSAQSIDVAANPLDILRGKFHIKEVYLQGAEGHLRTSEQGLNIDYFIEAFQSPDTSVSEAPRKPFALQVDHIYFDNVLFKFQSHPDSLDLSIQLAGLESDQLLIKTLPLSIRANTLYSDSFDLDIISRGTLSGSSINNLASSEPQQLLGLDFGIGFPIEVDEVNLRRASFSYHVNEVVQTPGFDPQHLGFNEIQISLINLSIHEDALEGNIDTLSAILPIIGYTGISGQIDARMANLMVSDLLIKTASSRAAIDIIANYPSWPNIVTQIDQTESEVTIVGNLAPADLSYFLPDSFMPFFEHWSTAEVALHAKTSNKIVSVESCDISVGDSRLTLNGNLENFQHGISDIRWNAMMAEVQVGSVFHQTLEIFVDSTFLPDSIYLQLTSSGKYDSFELKAHAQTNLGVVSIDGTAGVQDSGLIVDMLVDGEAVDLRYFSNLDWLNTCNFSLHTTGVLGKELTLALSGKVEDVSILDKTICDIQLQSRLTNDSIVASINILDSLYKLDVSTEILLSDQMQIAAQLQCDNFYLGSLLGRDSNTIISGAFHSEMSISDSIISGFLRGGKISMGVNDRKYFIDSLGLDLDIASTSSNVVLASDDISGSFNGNFDLRELPVLLDSIITENFRVTAKPIAEYKDKTFDFQVQIKNDDLLRLVGIDFQKFDGIFLSGQLDQANSSLSIEATTSQFEGLGISLDTISFNFLTNEAELLSQINAGNIAYDSIQLGDLNFRLFSDKDTSGSALYLLRDSVVIIDLLTRLTITDTGLEIYPDQLVIFDQSFNTSWENPVFVNRDSFAFDHLKIGDSNKEVNINGNINHFDIALNNIELIRLNNILSRDSALIRSGYLNGNISYDKYRKLLNCNIQIDSLQLAQSAVMNIEAQAQTEGSEVPFNIMLSSQTNNVNVEGSYTFKTQEIDATLNLDIHDAHNFEFATRNFLDKISGRLSGDLSVKGPISHPDYNGVLKIEDLQVVASGTGSTVIIKKEELHINNSDLQFDNFTIYDQKDNPLVVNGSIKTEDFQSIEYDLKILTDNYILFEQPRTNDNFALQGVLAIGSDITLTGSKTDTRIDAKVTILDTSHLTYIMPQRDIEFITDEGIVQFIDPNESVDSTGFVAAPSFYQSLVEALPSLDLNSVITLEKSAILKVVTDARAGDYIEAAGAANLELKLDRSGNMQLNGKYIITNGIYQLSFYGIAKKKFEIAPESEIQWNGDPTNGDLDILAIHRVKTSSTGLIGHEVGENEQSLYRRALNYEVGIVIRGTIEEPEISFTLDLPEEDRLNFPALNNKLSRLSQPEFASELNKQVFGLLVLGGFVPESSGSDFGELAVATTISNSVSAILTGQLNRFINENVEGLEVDIGMHSYSDYSTGGSQTRTAMDFRVTKRMLNDRLSLELGAEVDLNNDQSGANTGQDSFRGDIAVIYDLTESGNKKLKVFNNETYDIIYHEIRNTGIAIILIKEFDKDEKKKRKRK